MRWRSGVAGRRLLERIAAVFQVEAAPGFALAIPVLEEMGSRG
jgi:hypothetical protein